MGKNLLDILVVGFAMLGGLPIGPNSEMWRLRGALPTTAFVIIGFSLVTQIALAGVRIANINLHARAQRTRVLARILAVVRLNTLDTRTFAARLGVAFAITYLFGLLLLASRYDVGLTFIFVGMPQLGLSLFRMVNFQQNSGNLYLDILSGPLIGGQPRLTQSELTIGQSENNDIVLFNDHYVQPDRHACLRIQGRQVILCIYGAAYINGQQVAPGEYLIPLETVFQVGMSTFRLMMER